MSKVAFDFSDERYVVTGASSGIGRQITLDLAAAGATVLGIARNVERLNEVRGHFPENIFVASVDVCDKAALENAIKNFVAEKGKLNGGVHAAGIVDLTSLKNFKPEVAEKIMQVSFWAGVDFVKIITKSKYAVNGTSTVLFSSTAAIDNARGMFAYSAAKSAVNSFVKTVSKEIAIRNHRINSVMPGFVNTAMSESTDWWHKVKSTLDATLLGAGDPSDVSGAVLFLLSDGARWITGTNLVVDGGLLA